MKRALLTIFKIPRYITCNTTPPDNIPHGETSDIIINSHSYYELPKCGASASKSTLRHGPLQGDLYTLQRTTTTPET